MATKTTNRNGEDVFDEVTEHGDHDEGGDVKKADAAADVDDTAKTEPAEPTPEVDADESHVPRRWLRRAIVASACAVFVAVAAASAYLGWQLKQQNDTAAAGRAALAAAQKYAVTLTSVDTKNIDQNFNEVLNGATGEFKDMYSQSASQLRQLLIDNKAQSKGTVVDSAIKTAARTKVEVLLFIDQSISNVVNPDPRIDRSRVAITMELVDNRWLASKVDIK